ncbi:MAG TPA: ParB N-terminal domain-containing protein, partial [Burkholderiaceae bacterium]
MRAPSKPSSLHLPELAGLDQPGLFDARSGPTGEPLIVPIDRLDEDPHNPRTEFPPQAIDELAQDIAQRGVLQPIVVSAADE